MMMIQDLKSHRLPVDYVHLHDNVHIKIAFARGIYTYNSK